MSRRFSIAPVLIIALFASGQLSGQDASSSAGPVSSWHGKYQNSDLEFELKPTPFGGLTGALTFKGKVYTAIVRVSGEKLTGTFRSGNASFPYEATRHGDELRFVTGDTAYLLRREVTSAAAPSNPLARKNSPMQSPSAAPASPTGQAVQLAPGCSVRLPAGWTSNESSDGFMFLPAGVTFDPNREDNAEVYLAALRNDYDPSEEAQTVQQLSAAVALGGGRGGQRQTAAFGQRAGAIYRWELPNPQTGEMSAFDIYLVPEGARALVVIAAGEKARVRANDGSVRQILASLALAAPQDGAGGTAASNAAAGGPLADSTPLARRWLDKLRGKVVRQFWASQGMSSDKRHWLYADGTYAFKSSSMVSVDVPGAGALSTGRDNSTGRWRIRDLSGQVFLEVTYNNGNVQRLRITEDNRNWYLNGEKAFAVNPE